MPSNESPAQDDVKIAEIQQQPEPFQRTDRSRDHLLILLTAALAVVAVHVGTNGAYGLHRDELQVLDDACHLAWGFVAYPPLTPFIEHVALILFGHSLIGLRLFAVLAQGLVVFLTGLMARDLGGRRLTQVVAALAVATSPLPIFEATEFQYTSFDMLWCVLAAFFLIRLLKSENPRWWLGVGAAVGLGMMTKFTEPFYIAGIAAGVFLTSARRYLKNRWLWSGAALSLLIFLPNLVWQVQHHFVTIQFLRHIHIRDIAEGRTNGFIQDQFRINANFFLTPLWIAGIFYFFAARAGKRFRLMGWFWAVPVLVLFFSKGRGYYAGAVYPMLFAAGAILWECAAQRLPKGWVLAFKGLTFTAISVGGALAAALLLPILPLNSPHNIAIKINGDLREEVGWRELVATVARIRDSLSPAQRASLAIITGNYGETGAIDFYGPAYGLPAAISGTNTAWYRGYGNPPPKTLIVLGLSREDAKGIFHSCRLGGHDGNRFGIKNEESTDHPDIFVCGPPREPWLEFWKQFRGFG
jgi:4-amino-4-deoxy-L-arabinose transferase-like glycosyltransferase